MLVHYLTSSGSMLRKDLGEGSDEGSSTNSHEVPRCCCMPASLSASRALWFPGACALYRLALPVWCPATLQGVAQTAVGAVRSTLVDCQRARVVLPELQVSTSAAPRLQSVAAILDTTAPRNVRVPMSQHSSASETVDHSRPPEPQKQVRAGLFACFEPR